ncbi:MAG: hypothetical protein O7D32_03180 [bacterium]|nr:hypothetical protein [bacterium]
MKRICMAVALLAIGTTASAQNDATIKAYMEMLRSDVRAERIAIVTEVMDFTDEEAGKFWPVYRKFEKEFRGMNDRRLVILQDYAKMYWQISDDQAAKLMKSWLELALKQAFLEKDYYRTFRQAIGGKQAAKFMQLHNQIGLLVRLQLAAELPMIE